MKEKNKYLLEKIWLSSKVFFFFQPPSYSEKRAELAQARKRDYEKNSPEKFNETDALIAAQARKREREKNTYKEKYNDIEALIHQLENEGLAD